MLKMIAVIVGNLKVGYPRGTTADPKQYYAFSFIKKKDPLESDLVPAS